jgi:hypothetical protein
MELALNLLICTGSHAITRVVHIVCFTIGRGQSPVTTSWEDVFIWTVTGPSLVSWIGRV